MQPRSFTVNDPLRALGSYFKTKAFWWALIQNGHLTWPGHLSKKKTNKQNANTKESQGSKFCGKVCSKSQYFFQDFFQDWSEKSFFSFDQISTQLFTWVWALIWTWVFIKIFSSRLCVYSGCLINWALGA